MLTMFLLHYSCHELYSNPVMIFLYFYNFLRAKYYKIFEYWGFRRAGIYIWNFENLKRLLPTFVKSVSTGFSGGGCCESERWKGRKKDLENKIKFWKPSVLMKCLVETLLQREILCAHRHLPRERTDVWKRIFGASVPCRGVHWCFEMSNLEDSEAGGSWH